MRFVIAACLFGMPASAQTGILSGLVVDPVGVVVEGASVRAREPQSAKAFTATSSRDGKFSISVPYGTYDLTVSGVPAMTNIDRKSVKVDGSLGALRLVMDFNTQLGTLGEDRLLLA